MSRPAWRAAFVVLVVLAGCEAPTQIEVRHPETGNLEPGVAAAVAAARARWETESVKATGADAAAAHAALGKVYLANHFTAAAADAFALARGAESGNFRWHYFHALALLERGDSGGARRALAAALEANEAFWPAHYRLARSHLNDGNLDAASAHVEAALAAATDEPAVLAVAGELALHRERFADAQSYFERALRAAPHATQLYHPLVRAVRGRHGRVPDGLLSRAGDGEVYLDDPLEREIAGLAASAQIFLERGRVWLSQKNYPAAERAFRGALKRNPEDAFARVSLGRVLEIRDDAPGAAEQFDAALRIDPDSATVHYFAGAFAERRGDDTAALEHYARAVDLDPQYDEPRVLLAHAHLRAGDDAAAIPHYQQLAGGRPANITPRYYLAMIHLARGRCTPARARIDEALAVQANYGPILEAQARLFAVCSARDDERRESLAVARALMEARPDSRSAATLAIALAANGKSDEAQIAARQALALAPTADDRTRLATFLRGGRLPQSAWPPLSPDYRPPRLDARSLR